MAPIFPKVIPTEGGAPDPSTGDPSVFTILGSNPLVLWSAFFVGGLVIAALAYLVVVLLRRTRKDPPKDVEGAISVEAGNPGCVPMSARAKSLFIPAKTTTCVRTSVYCAVIALTSSFSDD